MKTSMIKWLGELSNYSAFFIDIFYDEQCVWVEHIWKNDRFKVYFLDNGKYDLVKVVDGKEIYTQNSLSEDELKFILRNEVY